jgi:hypothetical protein
MFDWTQVQSQSNLDVLSGSFDVRRYRNVGEALIIDPFEWSAIFGTLMITYAFEYLNDDDVDDLLWAIYWKVRPTMMIKSVSNLRQKLCSP